VFWYSQAKDLYEAAKDGDLDTIQAILTTNAAVMNVQDADGKTPLFWAVMRGETDVAKYLLSKGADPFITNNNGVSSFQMAKALGNVDVLGQITPSVDGNKYPASTNGNTITTDAGNRATTSIKLTSVHLKDGRQFTNILSVTMKTNSGNILIELSSGGGMYKPTEFLDDTFLKSWGISPLEANSLAKDYEQAKEETRLKRQKELQEFFDHGNADAQFQLGLRYYKSDRKVEAIKWFQQAADQGCAQAQFFLAVLYSKGEDVAIDMAKSVMWCRKAAEQGNADAQFQLGLCYEGGNGIPRDISEAVKWFSKAAEQGNRAAYMALAIMGAPPMKMGSYPSLRH
jgi:TPR repeat protein